MIRAAVAAASALVLALLTSAARAGDPYLEWYTLETPHFAVHFHSGLETHAQRLANIAETAHERLRPHLAWDPDEITHVVLTDNTDGANGSATALPYNAVRLFISAPDDMSALADYDDWLLNLFTHEHTHILHVDNKRGIPAALNLLFGKSYAPNQVQPRWILEGLAVAMESEFTSAGRIRSTTFDMYLRADVLEDNFASLDQVSHGVRRWPSANLWYLYGGRFIGWILDVYGRDTFATVAHDYGQNPMPWGINRSIRAATGMTYPELYRGWLSHLERRYDTMTREVLRRGLREGTRLTHRGRVAASPRFVPQCARNGPREEVLVFHDDGHETPGFYRLPLESRSVARADDAELVFRASPAQPSFDAECGIVFDDDAPSYRDYRFRDLYRLQPGERSTSGTESVRERWTKGRRVRDAEMSPDGRRVVYVTNRAGTSTLRIADLGRDRKSLENERALVPSATYEQAFTPRWSPDGKRVTYGTWTRGGFRDVRVVEVSTGRFWQVTQDRAVDQQPTFSPDGRFVFFKSDRTGIANIYAYEIATRKLLQVTNVINGAFMPEITPDGRTLFYIGYTHEGFDLFSMELEESEWLAATNVDLDRPPSLPEPPLHRYPVAPYNPLPTLRPHSYEILYGPGTFGDTLLIIAGSGDVVGHHGLSASLSTQTELPEPSWSVGYSYGRLPFSLRTRVFQNASPRSGGRIGDRDVLVTERHTGASAGIGFGEAGEYDAHNMGLTYTISRHESRLPVGENVDPYALRPRFFDERYFGLVSLGWTYGNSHGPLWGISRERGYTLALNGDFAARPFGSESTLTSITGRFVGFLPMPWVRHHALAVGLSGGTSAGSYARRGLFHTGGFVDTPVITAFQDGLSQGGFVLRGYSPRQFIGSQFNLLNVEYRMPLLYPEQGISTLPVFWRSLSAAFFADYGGAFELQDLDDPLGQYHLGVGGELWFDLSFGYFAGGTIRLGHARGVDDAEAVEGGQTYLIVSSVF